MGIWADLVADIETEVTGIEQAADELGDAAGEAAAKTTEFPWVFVIVAGLAAIAIIIIIIRGVRAQKAHDSSKKKKTLYEQGYLQYRSAKEAICLTYLNCDKGYFEGRRYPLTNRITIGKNPERCNICYPPGAGGIGSEHCEIRLRTDGQVELVDLGSMNGTFLENGRRLLANVPTILPNGGRFYIATAGEMYRLDNKA